MVTEVAMKKIQRTAKTKIQWEAAAVQHAFPLTGYIKALWVCLLGGGRVALPDRI